MSNAPNHRKPPFGWQAGLARSLVVTLLAGLALVTGSAAAHADEVYIRPSNGVWTLEGHGFGHGRGMSQWGAYGAATLGRTSAQILAFYYPGTTPGTVPNAAIRVRVTADPGSVRVSAATGLSAVLSTGVATVLPPDRDQWRLVPTGTGLQLQGHLAAGWAAYALGGSMNVTTPVRFQDTASLVRVWRANNTSVAYRGTVSGSAAGAAVATVVTLPLESYLRGVVPRESPASWPGAALEAQAVAARTYAYSAMQRNAGSTSDICDTTSCQVFGGTTAYSSAGTPTALEYPGSDAAVAATAGRVLMYAGAAAFTEFSASDGGWTTAGSQPYLIAQADPWDGAAPGDPVHSWAATLPASTLEAYYPSIGTLQRLVVTGRDGHGDWGGRVMTVRLEGTAGSVTTTGAAIASFRPFPTYADGLRSDWWTVDDQPPFGSVDGRAQVSGTVALVSGWAIDPNTTVAVTTRVLVDGVVAATVIANRSRPDVGAAYPGYGDLHGFSIPTPVTSASRLACVQMLNMGSGGAYPQPLACRAITTLGPTAPPTLVGGSAAVASASGTDWASMQSDGNLVVYDAQVHAVWNSATFVAGSRLAVQTDGNLVIYGPTNHPVWATMTTTGPGNRLIMQTDANLVLYSPAGVALWDSQGNTRKVPHRW